jgi:hypothetical protein
MDRTKEAAQSLLIDHFELTDPAFASLFAPFGSIIFNHSITQELVWIVECAGRKPELQVTIPITKQLQSIRIILKKIRAKNADLF